MTLKPASSVTVWTAREMSAIVLPIRASAIPASSAAPADVEQALRLRRDRADRERPGRVGDEAVERHADVDREDVAVCQRTAPGMPWTTMRSATGTWRPG